MYLSAIFLASCLEQKYRKNALLVVSNGRQPNDRPHQTNMRATPGQSVRMSTNRPGVHSSSAITIAESVVEIAVAPRLGLSAGFPFLSAFLLPLIATEPGGLGSGD